jgi:predicted ArsR family transcriptional regulator
VNSSRRLQNDLAALSNLDDTVRRRLYEYVASHDRPVGRDEAAAAARISRTLAAYHLDKLAEHELLTVSYERLGKRRGQGGGRPAKLYSRPPRELTVSVPPRDYLLAGRLLVAAAEGDANGSTREALAEAARTLGTEMGAARKKGRATSVSARRRTVIAALRQRGYEPYEDDNSVIRLRNCPFHELAQQNRGIVCTMNLSLLEGLLTGLETNEFLPSLEVEQGRCCVVLRPRAQRKPSQSQAGGFGPQPPKRSSKQTRLGERLK